MVVEDQNTNPDAEFKAPEWINTTLIQKALKKSEEHLKVQDISVKMATTPGENYSSSIYRVSVELSNGESRSFVVKGPSPGQTMREATLELDIFRREGFMLGDVIPQIETMLEEAAPGQFPPLAARCPLYDREYLVMQDLATAGFKMADRKRGLDLKHSLLALRSLARYHAGTHALLRLKPEIADRLPSMWLKPHPATAAFVEGGVQMAADACRLWPGYEEYATLLDEFKTIAMETFSDVNTPKPDEFTVIVHSDFWVNNMMFRYDEDNSEPKGHRMVDFQGSTVGSPTLDLLYFLSTSVTEEVSADNEDLLIREYHRTLDETLRLLKLEAPPLPELLRALSAHGPFALMGCLTVIPLVRAQRAADLEAGLAGDASALAYLYEDAAVRRWLQRLLPEYKRRGWLPRPDAYAARRAAPNSSVFDDSETLTS